MRHICATLAVLLFLPLRLLLINMNSRRMNVPHDAVTLLGELYMRVLTPEKAHWMRLLGTGVMWWDLTVDFVESIEAGPMEDYNRASSVYYLLKGGHVTVVQAPVRQHATLANEDEARYRETLAIIDEEVEILVRSFKSLSHFNGFTKVLTAKLA